jgi:cation transport ATPase
MPERPPHRIHVVHRLPGRVRIRVPGARRNGAMLEEIGEYIRGIEGVRSVEANPVTGSVLVHYDPHRHDALAEYLPAAPEFGEAAELVENIEREAEFLAAHSHTAAAVVDSARVLNRTVRRATGNVLDLKVLLPAVAAVWAFFEVGRDASTPMWFSLGIFSFNSFVTLHRPAPIRTMMVGPEPGDAEQPGSE